jgi:hypothetical protein
MKFEYIISEELHNGFGSEGVTEGYEMSILSYLVHHYQDCILAFRFWESFHRVHGYVLPCHVTDW